MEKASEFLRMEYTTDCKDNNKSAIFANYITRDQDDTSPLNTIYMTGEKFQLPFRSLALPKLAFWITTMHPGFFVYFF